MHHLSVGLAIAILGLVRGSAADPAACNGDAALCGRKYSNITFFGTHDSAFVGTEIADNQHIAVAAQLDFGIRFLQAQTHEKDGGIEMCHTECLLLDAGSLDDYLSAVAGWMTAPGHESEVVTLLLTNGDGIDVASYGDRFVAAGLDKIAFKPDGTLTLDDWPTLEDMINSNSRLVVFMDANADTSKVNYILPEFEFMWETPFGDTDPSFPTCAVDRPTGGNADTTLSLVNHVLNIQILPDIGGLFGSQGIQTPAPDEADTTNGQASLMSQVNLCIGQHGRNPNVVLVDFADTGDVMAVQKALNGL